MQKLKVQKETFYDTLFDCVVQPGVQSLYEEIKSLLSNNNYLKLKDSEYALMNIPNSAFGFLKLKTKDRDDSASKMLGLRCVSLYYNDNDCQPIKSIYTSITGKTDYTYNYFFFCYLPLVSDIVRISKEIGKTDVDCIDSNLRQSFENEGKYFSFYDDKRNYVCVCYNGGSFVFKQGSANGGKLTSAVYDYEEQVYQLVCFLIKNNLQIEALSDASASVFECLSGIYKMQDKILNENIKNGIICRSFFVKFIMNEENLSKSELQGLLIEQLRQFIRNKEIETASGDKNIISTLLNCEKVRADIEPYEEKLLTDPNRGHWDLYSENEDNDCYKISFNNFYARNPAHDINEDGAIAIDFGTKSTVVVYQKESQNSLPMGIGYVKAKDAMKADRYENPTVMQFVNIESFMSAYNASSGRPETRWEDIPISHTAMERFRESSSEDYYSFLYQLKQWAGMRNKKYRIKSKNGEQRDLPDFLSLKDSDFNPIELYAYYIGLYINNMRNGIYLDYLLSFPVTYEKEIRNKITESFERGLKKSLPETIVNNAEIMKNFRITNTFSEPQAYAACALREYGFEPDENSKIMYGIFDFGGGTTDFDFGIWKLPDTKSNKYNYALENFSNPNGDRYLGGENLLEMLAFEVFKDNMDSVMLKDGYQFSLPPGMNEFIGSDIVISESQEAEKNIHNLMEVLRPYWEQSESYYSQENGESASSEEKEILKVTLFNKEGKDTPNVELTTTKKRIYDFLEMKIGGGIDQFFDALTQVFHSNQISDEDGDINKVNIFLAGNSCKSPIVKKIFLEKINSETQQIVKEFGKDVRSEDLFELFPPLGTPEAEKKMQERNIVHDRPLQERPSGKTGVAFGLLKFRDDGIKIVNKVFADNEIPFRFYIGFNKKDMLTLFTENGKPEYGTWYKYIEADEDTVYLYYTDLPSAISGKLHINGNAQIKRMKLNIEPDENSFVYIKATGPNQIQYVVSSSDDVESGMKSTPVTRDLKVE